MKTCFAVVLSWTRFWCACEKSYASCNWLHLKAFGAYCNLVQNNLGLRNFRFVCAQYWTRRHLIRKWRVTKNPTFRRYMPVIVRFYSNVQVQVPQLLLKLWKTSVHSRTYSYESSNNVKRYHTRWRTFLLLMVWLCLESENSNPWG